MPMMPQSGSTASAPGSQTKVAPALTPEQEKALAKAREQERKAQEARKAEEQKKADKLAKERARRESEIAKKNAEAARKQAEEDQKRDKSISDAAARLKEAQSAYQSELEKAKGGSGDNKSAKSTSPSGGK